MRLFLVFSLVATAWGLDLSRAGISAAPADAVPAAVLREEVAKRSQVEWAAAGSPMVRLTRGSGPVEGFSIRTSANEVTISGNDARGVLFGVGWLLRNLTITRNTVTLRDGFSITTAPKYPLRGHQLGYRPKTNSYDAWDVKQWDQYIRDLAVFGANAIELIPPRSDDDADSPHFPLPPMRMMVEMSRITAHYGLDVWVWYPAMDKDYSDAKTVNAAVDEWATVLRQLPRLDAVFVPGGDPGHTQPKYLMALLEKQTASMHRFHPKAQMWVSPQGFTQEWLDEFIGILQKEQPAWLTGIVFGPQQRVPVSRLRELVPKRYQIRHYPDITHSRQSQYPAAEWDVAYAVTEGREIINPRPLQQARIFELTQPFTMGFLTYSEGCNDDVNKAVWSGLGWDPQRPVIDILREYARFYIASYLDDAFAQGLLALERNWRAPLATNAGVETTLEQFRDMERTATPQVRANWRFQQALYRAYYDAYVRARLQHEQAAEERALTALRNAHATGAAVAMSAAEAELDHAAVHHPALDLRARCFELAEALFQSVRMQLSVARYQAIAVDRGATLDTIDQPLNDRAWLKDRFQEIRAMGSEPERLRALAAIVNWTNPGPGGFYDDLGNLARQPHLVRGPGFHDDPAYLQTSLMSFRYNAPTRMSWWDYAESLNDAPLKMHYDNLDAKGQYRIRVVYAGDSPQRKIRMTAGGIEVHPLMDKPAPVRPLEFDIPMAATNAGTLDIEWTREPGLGGNGRGAQVAEVWLMRK